MFFKTNLLLTIVIIKLKLIMCDAGKTENDNGNILYKLHFSG